MTKLDQIKILDNKIRSKEAQFILDRKNAEISAKSSGELDKYKYLTGEDLGYKPDALTQAKFEYSPLGKVFTAGLDMSDKKDGLFKRLRSIEDKSGIPAGFYPQLPYYRPDKRPIDYPVDKKDDDDDDDDDDEDDDDDDKKMLYENIENVKKMFKVEGHLDESVDEEFNRIFRTSIGLKGKEYTIMTNKGLEPRKYDEIFSKLINDYLSEKIDYKIILDKKRSIDNATNYYERAKISQDPKIKETIINNKKISKALQEIIALIENDKLRRGDDFI